jgi:hypothetical protein
MSYLYKDKKIIFVNIIYKCKKDKNQISIILISDYLIVLFISVFLIYSKIPFKSINILTSNILTSLTERIGEDRGG